MKTQKTTRKKPHVKTMREKYELDRLFILRKMEETDTEYYSRIFEMGCLYAEMQTYRMFSKFPAQMRQYEEEKLMYNKQYWDWWKLEIKQIQNEIIVTTLIQPDYECNVYGNEIFRGIYENRFKTIFKDEYLQQSFNHLYERVIR